tara:strand:+ start:216 stop:554 length:339 start_codon:yes stop_codon:yes gene_type:complete
MKFLIYILIALFSSMGAFFLKRININFPLFKNTFASVVYLSTDIFLWLGLIFSGLAYLIYVYLIKTTGLASIPAVLATNTLVLGIVGYLSGESITLRNMIGYFLLIAGITLL